MRREFDEKFYKIQRLVKIHGKANHSLSKKILYLVKIVCSQLIGDKATLVPNPYFGESLICVENAITYSKSPQVHDAAGQLFERNKIKIINDDFKTANINTKYEYILFIPDALPRVDMSDFQKSLDILEDGGMMIAILPKTMLTTAEERDFRRQIMINFSLEAVLNIEKICQGRGLELAILIIKNKRQSREIYMRTVHNIKEDIVDLYKSRATACKSLGSDRGFFIKANKLGDSFEPRYYDPNDEMIRNFIEDKNTVKLHQIAYILGGKRIEYGCVGYHGDYAIVKARDIHDNSVHMGENYFISREFVEQRNGNHSYILRKGDILVSLVGELNWAIYDGEEDYAIANNEVGIIRGRADSTNWLNLFLNSKTGIEYFELQLEFFNKYSNYNHISIQTLQNISIPDINMEDIVKEMENSDSLEDTIIVLFRELGWDIKEDYTSNDYHYDLALYSDSRLRAVVDMKQYESEELRSNYRLINELDKLKKNIGHIQFYIFIDNQIFVYKDENKFVQLPEIPRPDDQIEPLMEEDIILEDKIAILSDNSMKNYAGASDNKLNIIIEKIDSLKMSIVDNFLLEKAQLDSINSKLDNITKKLEIIYNQIANYQALLDRQIKIAIDDFEKDRIIHAFSEECSERIVAEIVGNIKNDDYNIEMKRLKNSFGEGAWNKMSRESKNFLVSSKLMYNNLVKINACVDYSGVCLLVTKALEVEFKQRFYKNYLKYLKLRYNLDVYPTPLLYKRDRIIMENNFTMGSIAYVLCYHKNKNDSSEERLNNKSKLIEYCKERLFKGKSDKEIINTLNEYAQYIEEIRNDYRNPAAHTNSIKRIDADNCFDLVLDIKKIMKKMLDSFDE